MDFLDELNEEALLIIPNGIKTKILKYIRSHNPFLNVKIMSLDEVKRKVVFDYDVSAILYLMKKYNYRYEVAKILIDNMYYIDDKLYKTKKLNDLVELKKSLVSTGLLKEEKLFINKYKLLDVIVFGYDYITKYEKKLLGNFSNVKIIEKELGNKLDRVVYKFENINDEVSFVMKKIMNLIYEGIDINKIKITNLNDDYRKVFKRYSKFYNVPICLSTNISIYGTKIVQSYLNNLKVGLSFEECLDRIQEEYSLINEKEKSIFKKLVNITNKYVGYDYDNLLIIDAITYDLKNTNISNEHYDKEIEEISIKDNIISDEYIFLLGFNQGDIPSIYKDEDYISDAYKEEVRIDYVSELNKLEKDALISFLSRCDNIIISYKQMVGDAECYPSNLINELGYSILEEEIDNSYTYSNELSRLDLAIVLDNFIKYGIKNKDLELYFSNYEIPYLEYDNEFSGIDREQLLKLLNKELTLSYSAIGDYYKCAFRYYASSVLKIGNYETSFMQFVGNIYHHILECESRDGFDFDNEYLLYSSKRECSAMEKFFLKKLKEELLIILDYVREFHEKTELISILCEERIVIDKSVKIRLF